METMRQYVERKLREPWLNMRAVAKIMNISYSRLYHILQGGETADSGIQRLHDFFRKLGD